MNHKITKELMLNEIEFRDVEKVSFSHYEDSDGRVGIGLVVNSARMHWFYYRLKSGQLYTVLNNEEFFFTDEFTAQCFTFWAWMEHS